MKAKRYAIAVRDTDLLLVVTVVRDPKTDIYVNWPRDQVDPRWKPHASWHASGQYHNKSSGVKVGSVRQRQKPDPQFHGTENLVCTVVSIEGVRNDNVPCTPLDFEEVFEIPATALLPGIGRMQLSIDLTEPTSLPLVPNSTCPRFKTVSQRTFRDAHPWIVVTLFDTDDPYEPHPSSAHP
jgi:hypothetical protein